MAWRTFCGWVLLCAVATASGCWSESKSADDAAAQSDKDKAAQREKPDFELSLLTTQPNNADRVESHVKPGHWFRGELVAESSRGAFDGRLEIEPVALEDLPYVLDAARPARLAREQQRRLPFVFYSPVGLDKPQIGASLASLDGDELAITTQPLNYIPPHQYYLVVLADEPEAYGFLRSLPAIRAPSGMAAAAGQDDHYRVLLPRSEQFVPLPDSLLTWTSIAYLFWDDFDPDRLTDDQQQALVDWLHWGGQLVMSGPGSLERLRGSFLEPWLPAESIQAVELGDDAWASFQVPGWSFDSTPAATESTVAVRLRPSDEATVLSSLGDVPLLVERRVGRGRVCVSAVGLAEPIWHDWPLFDAWFNACVLRRSPRQFETDPDLGTMKVTWADGTPQFDARQTSQLRLFSRDTLADWENDGWHTTGWRKEAPGSRPPEDAEDWHYDRRARTGPGVGGWDDYGTVSNAARWALRDAAGLAIPSSGFVLRIVALYLAVLIPLNWVIFRALGRVEWAWAAVPVVSLAFTVLIARWAQLDIGFARAEVALNLVELHGDYPRAHVTRYAALYTSLTTTYDVQFADEHGVALPFPYGALPVSGARSPVTLWREQGARLEGLPVASNSIGLVHGESMLELDGAISLRVGDDGNWQVFNGSQLDLQQAGVVCPEGAVWIGRLRPGEAAPLEFDVQPPRAAWREKWDELPATAANPPEGTLSVRELLEIAIQDCPVDEGRLVAWTDQAIEGMTIEPASPQQRQATLIVAHLRAESLAAPLDDVNRAPPAAKLPAWLDFEEEAALAE